MVGNPMSLRGGVINIYNAWLFVPGKPTQDTICPIRFSQEEISKQAEDADVVQHQQTREPLT
jgi:hypothetical protein